MRTPNRQNLALAGALLALLTLALPVGACVETDGVADTNYVNLALPRAGICVCVVVSDVEGGSICSGVCLNSNWVLTAAHPFTDTSGNIVGTPTGILHGPPFTASSPMIPVSAFYIYPGFNDSGNGPDLTLLHLALPLNVPVLTIGTANPGDVVTSYGYGQYGTPSGGMNYADGNLRAWQATLSDVVNVAYSPNYFQMTDFGFENRGLLNGMAGIGDSGGGVFNSSGQLVGTTVAASSPSEPVGETIFDNLSQSEEYAWILNAITPVQPVIVSLTPSGADMQLAWQGKGGSNYVVQAASSLGGTNTFTDISGVITLSGLGPVTTNFLDPGALTNQTTRFYRVRSD